MKKAERKILDFSANTNPLGPPEWLRSEINRHISDLSYHPDPHHQKLSEVAAKRFGLDAKQICWGNGISHLLLVLARIIKGKTALIPAPCHSDYKPIFEQAGFQVVSPVFNGNFQPEEHFWTSTKSYDVVVLSNPNNPTGVLLTAEQLRKAIALAPETTFLIDEAYMDFCDESLLPNPPKNAVILRSVSNFFAIPGLCLGFAVARANLINKLRQELTAVNTLAQIIGIRALGDMDYRHESLALVQRLRDELTTALVQIPGLSFIPSAANYVLVHLGHGFPNASTLAEQLLKQGIAVRTFENQMGLDDSWIGIGLAPRQHQQKLIDILFQIWGKKPSKPRPKPKPALFFGGTGSNVGKTLMTAALCRILVQDGYRVAPFKAQNMSLQAYVTRDGLEMARAQALQARAAKLDPQIHMNPVLMKPMVGMGSQVILSGKPQGMMTYENYKQKRALIQETVYESYDQLSRNHEAIILEGAGSIAEVNLKKHDLVNLSMARYAHAPVILIGDIDRGGIFASFVGTLGVLAEWERHLIKGFLVNRFRGDARLLDDAYSYLWERTGKPVFGTIPYIDGLNLPEEDSVNFKDGLLKEQEELGSRLDVVVIDLPHISNFSDIDPLLDEDDVRVRTCKDLKNLGNPHVIVLPGTRNSLHDLEFLNQSGLSKAIVDHVHGGGELIAICGGLQISGKTISDRLGVEQHCLETKGLGLLDIHTNFSPEKTLKQCTGQHLDTNFKIKGYEIHHGQTQWGQSKPLIQAQDGSVLGVASQTLPVWGTYLHGLFDEDEFRRYWINLARRQVGLPVVIHKPSCFDLEKGLDLLADHVRKNLDMDRIYKEMGL